jgi:GNAT superfamily N-acetyltransferase
MAARAEPPLEYAHLLSIRVARAFRGRGIGPALLREIEKRSAACGCERLWARYSSRVESRGSLEKMFAAAAWTPPELMEVRICGTAEAAFLAMDRLEPRGRPWLHPDSAIDLWETVREDEREQVAELCAAIDFQADVSAGRHEAGSLPGLSLVLRHEGRIAGWVFGSVVSAPGERVSCGYFAGYVAPALRRRGSMIALMREACVRQRELFGPDSPMRMSAAPTAPGMPAFIRRRLGPYALWTDEMLQISKVLRRA